MRADLCDPDWQRFCASLREGTIYVKMPLVKARSVIINVELAGFLTGDLSDPNPAEELRKFLENQLREATNHCLFYAVPVAEARQDIESLILIESQDKTGILHRFRLVLESGLSNDPEVDWISRMGGPKPGTLTPPVTKCPAPQDPDLSDLSDEELFNT